MIGGKIIWRKDSCREVFIQNRFQNSVLGGNAVAGGSGITCDLSGVTKNDDKQRRQKKRTSKTK